jgi:acyl-CoA synthetase (AMP-forming)/AMP-acid ligase II
MLPSRVLVQQQALPRNPNGKIDRKLLAERLDASGESTS